MNTSDHHTENEIGWGKFIWIGLATATSGVLLKIFQESAQGSGIIGSIIHTLIVLIPAAATYYFLSKGQEKKLNQVVSNLEKVELQMKDLKRVSEIEKKYYTNERLLTLEVSIIEETMSSMREVSDLISEFDDGTALQIRLKERFKQHAKAMLTLHRTFSTELQNNLKSIYQIENEFSVLSHEEREQKIFDSSHSKVEKVYNRYNLQGIIDGANRITDQSHAIANKANQALEGINSQLEHNKNGGDLK